MELWHGENWLWRKLHYLILPIVAFCFVTLPSTNDLRIYLGTSNIAANYFPFPQGLDLAWEIKPMANRIINFIFYKIATLIVPMENHFWFGVAVKSMILLIVLIVCWYFAKQINIPYTFAITFLALTTAPNFFIGQAEYWMVVFSLLCIALILHKGPWHMFAAGCLIPIITLFKGISGVMLFVILAAVFLIEEKQFKGAWDYIWSYRHFIAGIFFCGMLFVAAQLTIWPNMLSDIIMSPYLANAGRLSAFDSLWRFVMQYVVLLMYFPVMIVGTAFGAYYLARIRYLNDRHITIAYAIMWLTPLIFIVPQGEYFLYQFMGFSVPAIVTMVLTEKCLQ